MTHQTYSIRCIITDNTMQYNLCITQNKQSMFKSK